MGVVARRAALAVALVCAGSSVAGAQDTRTRAGVEVEWRGFGSDGLSEEQTRQHVSMVFSGDFSLDWGRRTSLVSFEPFVRLDSADRERTHGDVRTLSWERGWQNAELRVGVRRVFWGVTESRHLVDVINQTDLVENPDGEDKLGQPMVNGAVITRAGTIDLFLLTGFRERTFPGTDGRLRAPLVVRSDLARFEDRGLARHLGWAARWSHNVGGWDIGLSHFHGTSREPRFALAMDDGGAQVLAPHYDRIHQTGIDAQLTSGGWLWKLEGMTRSGGPGDRVAAAVAGVEYTIPQFDGAADLGLLAEVLLDSRSSEPLQDDLFVGSRLVLNDPGGTELLAGAIVDRTSGATMLNVEFGRRVREDWSLAVEARGFARARANDPFYAFRRDDYVSISITRWF